MCTDAARLTKMFGRGNLMSRTYRSLRFFFR